jgi:hypothetical protein
MSGNIRRFNYLIQVATYKYQHLDTPKPPLKRGALRMSPPLFKGGLGGIYPDSLVSSHLGYLILTPAQKKVNKLAALDWGNLRAEREHPVFETTLVRAKHSDYQLLVLTERLFARMLRPYIIGMLRAELTKVELNWGKMIWKLWNCYSGSLLEKEILVGQI